MTCVSALSSFGPGTKKQAVYAYVAPSSAERYFVQVANGQSNVQVPQVPQVQGVSIRAASPLQSVPSQNYVSAQPAQAYIASPAAQQQIPTFSQNAAPQQNPSAVGVPAPVNVPQQYQYAIKQLPYYPP